jgi:hypothetical protein
MGVPAPATAALLTGFETMGGPEMRELTTPTGALLAEQLGAKQGPLPAMKITSVGHGAGSMKLQNGPNILRAVLGESTAAAAQPGGGREAVVELQTNIDDISPEVIGYTLRRLREAGALDVWTVPAQMKKDRPGLVLHVLTPAGLEGELVDLLFAETGTLGIRRAELGRYVAERGSVSVSVHGQDVGVKWGKWGEHVSLAPEYEDAARAAAAAQVPLWQIMLEALEAAGRIVKGNEPA